MVSYLGLSSVALYQLSRQTISFYTATVLDHLLTLHLLGAAQIITTSIHHHAFDQPAFACSMLLAFAAHSVWAAYGRMLGGWADASLCDRMIPDDAGRLGEILKSRQVNDFLDVRLFLFLGWILVAHGVRLLVPIVRAPLQRRGLSLEALTLSTYLWKHVLLVLALVQAVHMEVMIATIEFLRPAHPGNSAYHWKSTQACVSKIHVVKTCHSPSLLQLSATAMFAPSAVLLVRVFYQRLCSTPGQGAAPPLDESEAPATIMNAHLEADIDRSNISDSSAPESLSALEGLSVPERLSSPESLSVSERLSARSSPSPPMPSPRNSHSSAG